MKNIKNQRGLTQHHFFGDSSIHLFAKNKNPNSIKSEAGFTLMELLVYIGIVTIATVIFTGFLAQVTAYAARTRAIKEVSQNARLIMTRMTSDIRNADDTAISGGQLQVTTGATTAAYSLTGGIVTYDNDIADFAPAIDLSNPKVNIPAGGLIFTKSEDTVTVNLTVEPKNPVIGSVAGNQVALTSSAIPRKAVY